MAVRFTGRSTSGAPRSRRITLRGGAAGRCPARTVGRPDVDAPNKSGHDGFYSVFKRLPSSPVTGAKPRAKSRTAPHPPPGEVTQVSDIVEYRNCGAENAAP